MQAENKSYENDETQTVSSPFNFLRRPTNIVLNIALYPWADEQYLEKYRQVIEHYWYNVCDNRHVYLNWLKNDEWDGGYHKIPQSYFDIFIYDTLLMDYFVSQGWLSILDQSEIANAHEINPNILSLIEADNGKYYGIPIYKCFYVLVYHTDDKELASVKTFEDLLHIASKRHFIMRKPSRFLKVLNYLALLGNNHKLNGITEENLNIDITNRLSHFYKYSKVLLDRNDRYSFQKSSFYIGFSEDINTMLLVDENDLSQIEFMLVPLNNREQPSCWLDCIGIHPQTKLRGTYETSLQLANLMSCSSVMNECLQGQSYVITTNTVTLSHLASKNTVYAKLKRLIENHIFCPASSLPIIGNSSVPIQEKWTEAITLIITQHQKEMQSMVNTSTASS